MNLTGDVFLSAAFVSYLGAFTGPFRRSLSENWAVTLRDKGVRVSDGYSLAKVLESDQEPFTVALIDANSGILMDIWGGPWYVQPAVKLQGRIIPPCE